MLQIGRIQPLLLVQIDRQQATLQSTDQRQLFMPASELPPEAQVGQQITVFVYTDHQEQLTATTRLPKAQVGDVAWLPVVAVHQSGAFLDMGIAKDLFVAEREQFDPMRVGQSYAVYLYIDSLGRLAGTPHIEEHLDHDPSYPPGTAVNGLIIRRSELGYQVVVDGRYLGMLYHNELFQRVTLGQEITVYVYKIREDGRIDLRLQAPGDYQLDELQQQILDRLKQDGGYLAIGDKSDPKLIAAVFGVSKGQYKKAVGHLYRKKLIKISERGILLIEQ
ncbi:S1 RNA-binding domain-containing protein [Celerinatantimonas sp. YJH-8]|uniref:CvfB family protein n=1 Tax=Celerinatantimonas sp. YJH-8 TaxID=3228714 RepID=UPI0038BF62AE